MRSTELRIWAVRILCALAVAALSALVPGSGAGAGDDTPPIGLDALRSLDHLPLLRDFVCLQHSSYDRTGGNDDGFSGRYTHIRRAPNGDYVIFDAEGPGCIYRVWSAMPPEGYVKFYFDDETTPRLQCNFQEMFQDKVPPFHSPLTGQSSGGWYSYHPMPFAKRCVIATEKQTGFLAIAYHEFAPGTKVETFAPQLTPTQQATYDAVHKHFADPAKAELAAKMPAMKWSIMPVGGKVLTEIKGPATIRGMHLKLRSEEIDALRRVVLRIYWDGADKPAIECPLGDFVGTGFGDVKPAWNPGSHFEPMYYAAVPFGMTKDFCYFRLPMPFRKSARITIENGLREPVALGWSLDVDRDAVPGNAAYLHVQWRNHVTKEGEHVPILETKGRGHYVGTVLSMQSPWWLTYLEGDEKFYVDGEVQPSIHGTGTEDYFNCGWYYNKGIIAQPYQGLTVIGDPQSRTSQYRMHIPDCVPFKKSLKVEIEHGESNNKPYTNYAIVAYWYQDTPTHERPFEFPPAAQLRLPGTLVTYYENWENFEDQAETLDVEAGLQAGGGGSAFVPIRELDKDYEGPRRWYVAADRPGAYARWEVNVPSADLYATKIVALRRPDFGIVELYLDGEPTGQTYDLYFDRFHHEFILYAKPVAMTAGTHRVELHVVGKNEKSTGYNMALAAYRFEAASAFPKEWNVIGALPGDDTSFGYGVSHPIEQSVDLTARFTGATGDEIGWTKIQSNGLTWLHERFPPNYHCVAYAHTYVKSPDDREATALISTDDAGKLFVNGEMVWGVTGVNLWEQDKWAVPIKLKAGWNEVLIKVCQGEGAWGYSFRIADPSGELVYSTEK